MSVDITRVCASNFWAELPRALAAVCEAEFVAVDLEMTGIQTHRRNDGLGRKTRYTPEEYYQASVDAAKTFQILEVGLTCLKYDKLKKSYGWKCFNFRLAPWYTGDEKYSLALAAFIDRKFTISASTAGFLHRMRPDDMISEAFKDGVPFLSRFECQDAFNGFVDPDNKTWDHVDIAKESSMVQKFYDDVRKLVIQWLGQPGEDYLNIENPFGDQIVQRQLGLVRQLLKAEFDHHGLRCQSKAENTFIQITKNGANEYDTKAFEAKCEDRAAAIREQTGFRYIFEALVGGDFAEDIPLKMLLAPENKTVGSPDLWRKRLRGWEHHAKTKGRVVIGHNALMDMCFMYQSFVRPLPRTLKQFKVDIHTLFPKFIDTKVLCSFGDHEFTPDRNLWQLYGYVKGYEQPAMHPGVHPYYTLHQAGFDSWLTAAVFLKLSWKMGNDQPLLKAWKAVERKKFRAALEGADISDSDPLIAVATTGGLELFPNWSINEATFSLRPSPLVQSSSPATQAVGAQSLSLGPQCLLDSEISEYVVIRPLEPHREPQGDAKDGDDEDDDDGEQMTKNRKEKKEDKDKIPDWNSPLFKLVRGRLRMANAGTIDLSTS